VQKKVPVPSGIVDAVAKRDGRRIVIEVKGEDSGGYGSAAALCGTTHKTVHRVVERHNADGAPPARKGQGRNFDEVRGLVAIHRSDNCSFNLPIFTGGRPGSHR
jgi:hypothetical protein